MRGPSTPRSTTWPFALGALLALAVYLASGAYTVGRVRERFFRENVRAGEVTANALAGGAKIPLLADDTLFLQSLVEEAARSEGLAYAAILDSRKRVKAAASSALYPGILKEVPGGLENIEGGEQMRSRVDALPSGARLLRFSRPVTFSNKTVGYVVLGLSKDAIDERGRTEGRFLWVAFAVLGLCAVAVVGGLSIVLLGRRSGPAWSVADVADRGGVKTLPDSELERSHVTVLFAGVKGFKTYADTREPGQVFHDMNSYLAVATETITTFGGEVDKFVGDAVIGVFRSTAIRPDHIERAVRSAAALQRTLRQAGGDGNPLYPLIGIGISSGVTLAGRLAAGEHREPLYIGETFKSAYLLHVMSRPGEIVISRDIYQVMESSVSVEPLPPIEMMERTEPWENFRLLRVLNDRTIAV